MDQTTATANIKSHSLHYICARVLEVWCIRDFTGGNFCFGLNGFDEYSWLQLAFSLQSHFNAVWFHFVGIGWLFYYIQCYCYIGNFCYFCCVVWFELVIDIFFYRIFAIDYICMQLKMDWNSMVYSIDSIPNHINSTYCPTHCTILRQENKKLAHVHSKRTQCNHNG